MSGSLVQGATLRCSFLAWRNCRARIRKQIEMPPNHARISKDFPLSGEAGLAIGAVEGRSTFISRAGFAGRVRLGADSALKMVSVEAMGRVFASGTGSKMAFVFGSDGTRTGRSI